MCVGGWGAFRSVVVSDGRLVLEFGGGGTGESVVMLLALALLAALVRLLSVLLALGCQSCSCWY